MGLEIGGIVAEDLLEFLGCLGGLTAEAQLLAEAVMGFPARGLKANGLTQRVEGLGRTIELPEHLPGIEQGLRVLRVESLCQVELVLGGLPFGFTGQDHPQFEPDLARARVQQRRLLEALKGLGEASLLLEEPAQGIVGEIKMRNQVPGPLPLDNRLGGVVCGLEEFRVVFLQPVVLGRARDGLDIDLAGLDRRAGGDSPLDFADGCLDGLEPTLVIELGRKGGMLEPPGDLWKTERRFQSVRPSKRSHLSCDAQGPVARLVMAGGSKVSTLAAQARASR